MWTINRKKGFTNNYEIWPLIETTRVQPPRLAHGFFIFLFAISLCCSICPSPSVAGTVLEKKGNPSPNHNNVDLGDTHELVVASPATSLTSNYPERQRRLEKLFIGREDPSPCWFPFSPDSGSYSWGVVSPTAVPNSHPIDDNAVPNVLFSRQPSQESFSVNLPFSPPSKTGDIPPSHRVPNTSEDLPPTPEVDSSVEGEEFYSQTAPNSLKTGIALTTQTSSGSLNLSSSSDSSSDSEESRPEVVPSPTGERRTDTRQMMDELSSPIVDFFSFKETSPNFRLLTSQSENSSTPSSPLSEQDAPQQTNPPVIITSSPPEESLWMSFRFRLDRKGTVHYYQIQEDTSDDSDYEPPRIKKRAPPRKKKQATVKNQKQQKPSSSRPPQDPSKPQKNSPPKAFQHLFISIPLKHLKETHRTVLPSKATPTRPIARVTPRQRPQQPLLFSVAESEQRQLDRERQRIEDLSRQRQVSTRAVAAVAPLAEPSNTPAPPATSRRTQRGGIAPLSDSEDEGQSDSPATRPGVGSSASSYESSDSDGSDVEEDGVAWEDVLPTQAGREQTVATNYKGRVHFPFNRRMLVSKIKIMIENDLNDTECSKRLDSARYGFPPNMPNHPLRWRAQVFRDAVALLNIEDTRNLEQRRRAARIEESTLKKRISDLMAPCRTRKSTVKNGILSDGSRSDSRLADVLNRSNLPVPKAVVYVEEKREDNTPFAQKEVKRLIREAVPAAEDTRWSAERVRLAIILYAIPDHRKGIQHQRKKKDLISQANVSVDAFKVLLLEYLTNLEAREHNNFSYAAQRFNNKVWVPKAVRMTAGLKERTRNWTPELIEKAVRVFKLNDHVKQRFARKDFLAKGMREGAVNCPGRIDYIKEYLLASVEDMMLLNVTGIYTAIAGRINHLNVQFPTIIGGHQFQGTKWRAGWVREALRYFRITIPKKVMFQRRILIEKMRTGGIDEPARVQAIKDYVESLATTSSYARIAQNLKSLSKTRDSQTIDTPIYIPTIFGGSGFPNHSIRWLSHHVAQVAGDYSKGHTRPDLLDIIRNKEADEADRILALSQYIDHFKFQFSHRFPKPRTHGKHRTKEDLAAWEYQLYRRMKDAFISLGIYVPLKLLEIEDISTTLSLYRPLWTVELVMAADLRLGEVWAFYHPLGNVDEEGLPLQDQENVLVTDNTPVTDLRPLPIQTTAVRKGFTIPKLKKPRGVSAEAGQLHAHAPPPQNRPQSTLQYELEDVSDSDIYDEFSDDEINFDDI